ncbi:PqiC family protein [Methyloversatilis thermotolerans]|uniref:PqiC family protein n=1 Tax=Methyloversatilis thermotolerans TaxID=1346290 RepID=UPI00036BA9CC|nr:PqiC family protein [Methyloversatilis thermotolerans]
MRIHPFHSLLLVLMLTACGSSPPARLYTLAPEDVVVSAAAATPTVVVGPVSLPESIDRLQITRRGEGGVTEAPDGHRWAGSMKSEVGRRLALAVARERGLARVVAAPQNSVPSPDYSVPVDVLRFDAEGFSRVTLDAVWSVRRDGREIASGRFTRSEAVAAADYPALIAAHGRLLDALAADLARAIP